LNDTVRQENYTLEVPFGCNTQHVYEKKELFEGKNITVIRLFLTTLGISCQAGNLGNLPPHPLLLGIRLTLTAVERSKHASTEDFVRKDKALY